MSGRAARAAILTALTVGAGARPAQADQYSGYERATIEAEIERSGGRIDPSPEGKRVESIEVVTLDVIEKRDPAPGFLNWFHATTRAHIVEREVLLRAGAPFSSALADETARNLRDLRQLSVVLVLPLAGRLPDRVKVLVITKDVWSLRLNTSFRFAGGKLEILQLQPSEENVLGSHVSVLGLLLLELDTLSLGGRLVVPRIAGSRVQFALDANVITNRASGAAEGSFGAFGYGQPLYSTQAEWAWGTVASWRNEVTRRFVGGELASYDAAATPADDAIPYVYDSDLAFWQVSVTRSFGRDDKHDLELGLEASRRAFRVPDLSAFDPAAVRDFAGSELPVTDNRVGPFVQLHEHSSRYMSVLDFETLGLQEDVALGHEIWLKLYPASKAAASSRDLLGTFAGASYSFALGDGLLRPYAASSYEAASTTAQSDGQIEAGIHVMTPQLGFGRLVYDGGVINRYRDYLNKSFALGGESRLRGYPTQGFIGKDVVASNLELRTRSIEILTAQLGLALFYDVGDAFDGFDHLRLRHGAGVGLRALFPQLDRYVLRADVGFPLESRAGGRPDLVITFRQAFGVPAVDPLVPALAPRPR